MESLEFIRKMDINKVMMPLKSGLTLTLTSSSRRQTETRGRSYKKWSWMANLAISLLLCGSLLLPTITEAAVNPLARVIQRRDTNPPFPFTSYSEESDEGSVTTTADPFAKSDENGGSSTKKSVKSSISSSEQSYPTLMAMLEAAQNATNMEDSASSSVENETTVPTYDDMDASDVDDLSGEGSGAGGTTYTSLLSPVPTTPPSPFSSVLINKTARNFSNRVGLRGLDSESKNRHNANSVLEPDTGSVGYRDNVNISVSTSPITSPNGGNGSLLRAARPTSSVISYNPSNYNRVVKRRKITSISGRNNNMTRSNGSSDVTTTPVSYVVTISEEESVTDEAVPSHPQGNTTSSRAIAGFSKGPSKIVTKTRPKPIIIRDHEAYFRNLSTDASPTTESASVTTVTDIIEDDTQNPTVQPGAGVNVLPSPPFKVRRVKVTMRRPGVVNAADTIPLPQKRNEGVEFVTPPLSINNTNSSEPSNSTISLSDKNNNSSNLMAAADNQGPATVEYSIRPSPSIRDDGYIFQHSQPPVYSSKRIYKEDFVIQKDSYGHQSDDDDSHFHSGHDHHDDMDVDATTEQYHSVEPPTGSYSIESSMDDDNHHSLDNMQISSPKYRDYFSDIDSGGSENGAHGNNHNHLYSNSQRDSFDQNGHPQLLSSGLASVTVTVTKTVIHDTPASSLPYDHSHEQSDYNPNIPINQNYNNQHVQPTPVLPFNTNPPASPTFQIRQDESNLNSAPVDQKSNASPVSNSVEEGKIPLSGNSSSSATNSNHHEDGHGHQNEKNDAVNPDSHNQSQSANNNHPEQNANESDRSGSPPMPINPTTVISSKDLTSVYYTRVVEPHFHSSSYEFSSSKEYSYFIPDPHHPNDGDNEDHAHHGHSQEQEAQDINPTSIKPFWDSSATLTNASSSQTPVIIDLQPGFSTPQIDSDLSPPPGITHQSNVTNQVEESAEIAATEQDFPFPSGGDNENAGSNEDKSESKNKNLTKSNGVHGSEGKVPPKDFPVPRFPARYQVPILVKIDLELPQKTFCSHLTNFKQMIVMVYGDRHTGLDENQVMIYTEPNCTSVTNETYTPTSPFDFGPTEPSKPNKGRKNTTLTTKPTDKSKIPNTDKNDTSIPDKDGPDTEIKSTTARQKLAPESERKNTSSSPSRKRRSPQKASVGESLILDRRASFERDDGSRHSRLNSTTPVASEENLSVYFFMSDKNGEYDQELTMAFLALWNETQGGNGSFLEGIFYQKIKKVDMVSSSQLVSPEDTSNENSGIIAAIAIASIAATCLFLIGVLLLVLRHRQAQTKFAKRCTPVTLDDYSLDNISFSNSFRRKQRLRGSKRSYTNAAFDDHNAPSRVVNSASLHAALTDSAALECEFREIPISSPTLDDIPQGAEAKNRYANVIPMPDTRVLLTFQDEQPNSDYINANYVRGPNGEPKRYIITQGPLDETTVDFWRMIWEQQVRVIFMLTDFSEGGIPRCAEYYPRSETIDCSQLHGDYQVTLEKRDITENCITSYLVIKDMERNLRRDVIHLWYHSWPDKGVPPGGKPTADFLLKARKFTKEPTPVVVHCSPGTGRSGTIVACDIAMKEYETQQKVDIPRLVLRIRQDRSGAVQTKDQYVHIYEVLHYYASRISATQMESIP